MNSLSNHRPKRTQAPKPPSSCRLCLLHGLPEGHCHSFTVEHLSSSQEWCCSVTDNSLLLRREGNYPTACLCQSCGKTYQERPLLLFTYSQYMESTSWKKCKTLSIGVVVFFFFSFRFKRITEMFQRFWTALNK